MMSLSVLADVDRELMALGEAAFLGLHLEALGRERLAQRLGIGNDLGRILAAELEHLVGGDR